MECVSAAAGKLEGLHLLPAAKAMHQWMPNTTKGHSCKAAGQPAKQLSPLPPPGSPSERHVPLAARHLLYQLVGGIRDAQLVVLIGAAIPGAQRMDRVLGWG